MSNIGKQEEYFIENATGRAVSELQPGEVDMVYCMEREPTSEYSGHFNSYDKFGRSNGGGSIGRALFERFTRITEEEFKRLCHLYVLDGDECQLSELPADADLDAPEWSWAFPDGSARGHVIHCDSEGNVTRYLLPRAVSQLIVYMRDYGPTKRGNEIRKLAADIQRLAA